jgi:hypothetical protein
MRLGFSLSLNSPNCLAYVTIKRIHDVKSNPDAKTAAKELVV